MTASATVGRHGDRPVHGIPGIKHWAQGACTRVHVQPISDGLLGVHLLHFLRTMDRLGMVMHANYRDAMLLHALNFEPSPTNQHTYLHLMMFISFPCCSFVGIVLMFVGLYVVLWAKNREDNMFADLTAPSETGCDIESSLLQ